MFHHCFFQMADLAYCTHTLPHPCDAALYLVLWCCCCLCCKSWECILALSCTRVIRKKWAGECRNRESMWKFYISCQRTHAVAINLHLNNPLVSSVYLHVRMAWTDHLSAYSPGSKCYLPWAKGHMTNGKSVSMVSLLWNMTNARTDKTNVMPQWIELQNKQLLWDIGIKYDT